MDSSVDVERNNVGNEPKKSQSHYLIVRPLYCTTVNRKLFSLTMQFNYFRKKRTKIKNYVAPLKN